MGKRSRARNAGLEPVPAPPPRAAADPDVRRTLGALLAGAMVLAVLVLVGTVTLQGALGPWLTLIVVAAGALALLRWSDGRLAGVELTGEDRTLRTMATGLLALVVGFGVLAAILVTALG